MSVYNFFKGIAHKFFPSIVEPYRRFRIHIGYLLNIPDEIYDAIQIRRKAKTFRMKYPEVLTQYYNENNISDSNISGIIFMVDGKLHHGGPSDRLRGILTTYKFAKKHNLPFYIYWIYPFNLTDYLVPSSKVDWTIKDSDISFSSSTAYPVVIMKTDEPQTQFINWLRFKMAYLNHRQQIHIYSNADNEKSDFPTLYHELFKPSIELQSNVNFHLSKLGKSFYSFTFRFLNLLGDFKEHSNEILSPECANNLIDKICNEFTSIIINIPMDYRILVTSDSRKFLEVIRHLDSRIYIVPGEIQNIDLVKEPNKVAWMKTFTDQQLIMHAEKVFLLRTGKMYKSGFPEFAANIGRKPFIDHKF